MKNLLKQSVASVLLVSLLLQSCYNPNSFITPKKNDNSGENLTFEPMIEAPLPGEEVSSEPAVINYKPITTPQGHQVTFHQLLSGNWQAQVKEKIGTFSRDLMLPVYLEGNKFPTKLRPSDTHITLPEKSNNLQGYVYIGSWGLPGGGNNASTTGKKKKEEEKKEKKEKPTRRSTTTDQYSGVKPATNQDTVRLTVDMKTDKEEEAPSESQNPRRYTVPSKRKYDNEEYANDREAAKHKIPSKRKYDNEEYANDREVAEHKIPSTVTLSPISQLTKPFEVKSQQGTYTVYPKISIQLRDEVFKQTGLWLRFPQGQTEIAFVIGQGYFGGMYLAQSKDTKRFLGIKIITGEKHIQGSAQEGRLQMQLNGLKHLMPLVDSFTAELQDDKVLFHVMPLAGLGNVKAISKALQQKELPIRLGLTYHIAKGAMAGLQQMHNHHLYHLDLKAANVVVDKEGKVWVIDFGCMQKSDSGSFDRDCNGDIDCFPPERRKLRNGGHGRFSGAAADSWAVGIVLLQLLAGELDDRYLEDPQRLLDQWQRDNSLPKAWIQFLRGLLATQEANRPSMAQALEQLESLEPGNLGDAIQQLPALVHSLQTGEGEVVPSLVIKSKKQPDFRPIPQLSPSELQKFQPRYQKVLKDRYLQNNTLTPLFGKPLALESSYINLTVIQTEERKEKKEKDEANKGGKEKAFQDERLSSFEDLFGEKRQISVEQLFDSSVSKGSEVTSGSSATAKHKFALVQGRAGIGKTTLSRYISYLWAKDKLWKEDYDWVFRITLRELTQNPAFHQKTNYTLEELVYHTCFPNEEWPTFAAFWRQHLMSQTPEKLLFILDGYDEIATITSNQKHPLYQPLQELLYQNRFTTLLTSRPYGLSDLPQHRQNLEVMGFSHDNIEAYVNQYFTQLYPRNPEEANTRSNRLLSFLKQHPSVWSNAHIPINLNLLCGIQEKLNDDRDSFSMSELYLQLEETLLQRAWELEHNQKLTGRAQARREQLYQHYVKERHFLQRLAFQAMQQESLIINADLLESVLKHIVPQHTNVKSSEDAKDAFIQRIHQIGLLKPTTTANTYTKESERDKPHEFMHLTFQEYFAAHYVAEGLLSTDPGYRSEVTHFIRTEKFNPQYQIIFWFVAGILKAHGKKLGDYLKLLQERASRDLLEDYQMGLLARCYEESYSEAADQTALKPTLTALQAYLKRQLQWVKYYNYTCFINTVANHFFTMLPLCSRLHQQLGDWLATDIRTHWQNASYNRERINVCKFIGLTQFAHPRLVEVLIGALKNKEEDARKSAVKTLGNLVEKVAIDQVIKALTEALNDKEYSVRYCAAGALMELGSKAATKPIINKALLESLKGAYTEFPSFGCRLVVSVLGNWREKAATEVVIKALVGALKNQSSSICRLAAKALGNLRGKAATDQVIKGLVKVLKDQEGYVRSSAAEALGNFGEKAATDQVIKALIEALNDKEYYIRSSAAEALGKLGNKAATELVIKALVEALKDQEGYVRSSVAEALDQLGEKAATDQVIKALVEALKDQDCYVRRNAAEALGKLGKKAATEFVIKALGEILKDKDWQVRRSAISTLVKLGEKVATELVIKALGEALKDQKYYVRYSAAEAFGKLGEKAATDIATKALIEALKDKEYNVRKNAAEAIGKLGNKAAISIAIKAALIEALKDKDADIRGYAASVLASLGEKSATESVVNDLLEDLKNKDYCIRWYAALALENLKKESATGSVIKTLVEALKDKDVCVRGLAASMLGDLGEKSATEPVINALVEALKEKDYYVKMSVVEALENLGKKAATELVIKVLIEALKDKDQDYGVRHEVVIILENLGKKAVALEPVINALVEALMYQDYTAQNFATSALGNLGRKVGATDQVSKALVEALKDKEDYVRRNAAEALKNLRKKAATEPVIKALVEALKDQNIVVRRIAANALSELGEEVATDQVINALVVVLKDQDYSVRNYAAEALGKLGEKGATEPVINALVDVLMNQGYSATHCDAARALGNLGGKAATEPAIKALVVALDDTNFYLRRNAASVLENLGEKSLKTIISMVLATPWNIANVSSVIGWVYCCIAAKAALQILFNQQKQAYSLVAFANKVRYVHTITPAQAQVLLHLLPTIVSMFRGLEPLNFDRRQEIFQQLPPIDKDPLLQELRATTEVPETKPTYDINRNDIPEVSPTKGRQPSQALVPHASISSGPNTAPTSLAEGLKSALQSIVTQGTLTITQEGKVVKANFVANSNSTDVESLLMDLQPSLEALPEWKNVEDCDIEGGKLMITMKTTLNAKQLQKKLEGMWEEVKA